MIYETIIEKALIKKGWSADKKYRIRTASGETCLLRIGPQERAEKLYRQHQQMVTIAQLGIPMNLPLEQGVCPEGPYLIQSWIEGRDAEEVLPTSTREQQYAYGLEAGRILKTLHSIPAPADITPWDEKFNRKLNRKLTMYEKCPLKYPGGEALVRYIAANRHLLKARPQTLQHGDYHTGNMMISSSGELTIIDFDKWDYGDPWEEFNRIVWCAQNSPAFASGRVDGYFDGEVPEDFWQLLTLYTSSNTLGSLPWAIPFGDGEIAIMQRQAAQVLQWYDCFQRIIPIWYHKP